jgi:fluoride exporter
MSSALAVALGAVLGAWLRWGLTVQFNQLYWIIPVKLGTLMANLTGAALMGVAIAWLQQHESLRPEWRLFINTGFLGALTTYSSWSQEAVELLQRQAWFALSLHLLLHAGGSLLATLLGLSLALHWLRAGAHS